MRTCVRCKIEKENTEFIVKKNGLYNSWCKQCVRTNAKKKYESNKETYIERSKLRNLKFRFYIYKYLLEHPCVDCGETDPAVLQFDHINREEKTSTISNMKMRRKEIVDEEISKCEVRCANCHARKTAKQFNYYDFSKLKYAEMVEWQTQQTQNLPLEKV